MRVMSDIYINDFESECISEVWDYYYEKIVTHECQALTISLLIIKLMNVLKRTNNKGFITKALLITISFFKLIPSDLYNNRGIDIDLLPLKYRKKAILLLRQEFS